MLWALLKLAPKAIGVALTLINQTIDIAQKVVTFGQ